MLAARAVRVSAPDSFDVDPLAATAELRAGDLPLRPPPRISPEALARPTKLPTAWIVVFVVAAGIGIGLGLLVGR